MSTGFLPEDETFFADEAPVEISPVELVPNNQMPVQQDDPFASIERQISTQLVDAEAGFSLHLEKNPGAAARFQGNAIRLLELRVELAKLRVKPNTGDVVDNRTQIQMVNLDAGAKQLVADLLARRRP